MKKVRLIILDRLSDIQENDQTLGEGYASVVKGENFDFIKFLLNKYPNTDEEVDEAKEFSEFQP